MKHGSPLIPTRSPFIKLKFPPITPSPNSAKKITLKCDIIEEGDEDEIQNE